MENSYSISIGVGVTGVNQETILAAGISTNSTFRIKVPKITNPRNTGLYLKITKEKYIDY